MISPAARAAEMGEALQAQARQMFQWWHRVRDGMLTPARCRSSRPPVRREIKRLVEAGHTGGAPKTVGTCREIFKRR